MSSYVYRVVKDTSQRYRLIGEIGQVLVEFCQMQAGIDSGLGSAVVANACNELEELINVIVELQEGVLFVTGAQKTCEGEIFVGEVGLDGVRKGCSVEVVFAPRAALEEEFPFFSCNCHFRRTPAAGR